MTSSTGFAFKFHFHTDDMGKGRVLCGARGRRGSDLYFSKTAEGVTCIKCQEKLAKTNEEK